MRMYTDPKGEAYERVIDLAIRNSECFVLGEKIPADVVQGGHYINVLEALEPYLKKTIVIQGDNRDEVTQIRNTYRSHAFYTAGTYYLYRCCKESGNLLKQMASRLSDWIYPNLPEDLCFLKEGGGDYLYSVVHEHMYGIDVTEEEAVELMDRMTGLFLKLNAHRNLDRLLDDAIMHKTDWLYISGLCMIKRKPDFLYGMKQLKYINVSQDSLWETNESEQ